MPTQATQIWKAILPVLDLMQGKIVRGIGGRRDAYRPIVSRLTDSPDPLAVARAFRQQFGFDDIYLADIDAIQTGRPAMAVYEQLCRDGFRLWIDAGLRNMADAAFDWMLAEESANVVVGLESIDGPDALAAIRHKVGEERTVFSLDLKAGRPLARPDRWAGDAWSIAESVIALGIRRLIVLDLAAVGVGNGVATENLCARLKQANPDVELTTGGGVRNGEDVGRLLHLGIDRVLVASALHDGRLFV
jgi:phosphoribosylformimino-5-aminoimidazole carboxamide ribotide isomerase